jgi:predicted PurR-regulated permease PerM
MKAQVSAAKKIDITSGTIFRVVLIVLGFWLVYTLFDIVLMLFAAFIVASLIEPIARYLDKWKIPRAVTVLIFYALVLLGVAGLVTMIVEPVVAQSRQLAAVIPTAINSLSELTPLIPRIEQAELVNSIQSGLLNFSDNFANLGSNIFAGTRSVIIGFVNFLFVFVIALYLVVEKNALKKLAKLLMPAAHYPYVARMIERVQKNIGRWVVGQSVMGLIVGSLVGISLWIIGVPYTLLLALLAGVLEIVPAIGPFIAATFGVLVALTQGWWMGLTAMIAYTVIGQFENHILVPNIMRRAVGLPPLVTIIAVILGARLLGIIGIIFAVPAAMIVAILISDIAKSGSAEELSG